MKFSKKTVLGIFLNRPNRFQAFVEYDNTVHGVHVPNTGRTKEILVPGTKVLLRREDNPARKTAFSLIGAYKGDRLINIDSQVPNKVVEEALAEGRIPELVGFPIILREKTYGSSRFDFRLERAEGGTYWLEVKGVTLEHQGVARFPDAPTVRGTRHLRELVQARKEGHRAGVLFVLQMEGMRHFEPARELDPDFAAALREAEAAGVDILAYECGVTEDSITITTPVPVRLEP